MNGIVTFYNKEKFYGFIESQESKESYFFHVDTSNPRKERKAAPKEGDEVVFNLVEDKTHPGQKIAVVQEVLGNERWEALIERLRLQPVQRGYLKRINGSWFFKVMPEKMMIPMKGPGVYEINVAEKYEARENQLVDVTMTVSAKGAAKAQLTDAAFHPDFLEVKAALEAEAELPARISGQNKDVYFVQLKSLPLCVIRKKTLPKAIFFEKGQEVLVNVHMAADSMIAVHPAGVPLNTTLDA
ncbi:cold shock domain-containing protein [Flaviaesturariibacter aridisoli]|uniref:Cold shock domain-containing protein n=1 Tax=Flaviaesturariibacter aridisoli TaxID=2545761 RepID=A0A4R4E3N6_9BACT|nr:cold shock domain-containing protein [Flaviaesturariibacter aridisoli]TCZ73280.1 cold shock domain-containing protein [Flaviaesturariibacter aridisoli]